MSKNDKKMKLTDNLNEYLEYITLSWFGRLIVDTKDQVSLDSSGGKGKMQKAFSVLNTKVVEVLLTRISDIIFAKLKTYSNAFDKIDPADQSVFDKFWGKSEFNKILKEKCSQFITDEEMFKDFEIKEGIDIVTESTDRTIKMEFKKASVTYNMFVFLKTMRLADIITTMSLEKSEIKDFIVNIAKPDNLLLLVKLMLLGQYRVSILAVKVLNNLIKNGLKNESMEIMLDSIKDQMFYKSIWKVESKLNLRQGSTLEFLMKKVLILKSYKYNNFNRSHKNGQKLGSQIIILIQKMLVSTEESVWKQDFDQVLNEFLVNPMSWKPNEYETIMEILGASISHLDYGAHATNLKSNQVCILGYLDEWYSLKGKNNIVQSDLTFLQPNDSWTDIKQQAIVCDYDSHKYKIELNDVSDLVIANRTSSKGKFVLDQKHLSDLINIVTEYEDDSGDLLKRYYMLKALTTQINYSNEVDVNSDINTSFSLLKQCLTTTLIAKNDNPSGSLKQGHHEWKLHKLLKYATENRISLGFEPKITWSVNEMKLVLSVNHQKNDSDIHIFKILKAFNYKSVQNSKKIWISDVPGLSVNVVWVDSTMLMSEDVLVKTLDNVNIIVTNEMDLHNAYDRIKDHNKQWICLKSIISISNTNFAVLKECLTDKCTKASTEDILIGDEFVNEYSRYSGVDKSFITKSIKGASGEGLLAKVIEKYCDAIKEKPLNEIPEANVMIYF
jgi:hypothetical protein